MKGLAPQTAKIFNAVSVLPCIEPYTLVGGTALSLQIKTRLSEDLDFMSWKIHRSDKCEIDWNQIERELRAIGNVENVNLLGLDHVEYIVNGVKISFYACDKKSPVQAPIRILNNIKVADLLAIGAMKIEVMLRRNNFRDYYDIYSLLKHGIDLNEMLSLALSYSRHVLKSKNALAMLTNGSRFIKSEKFSLLNPIYDITATEIEFYIKNRILEYERVGNTIS